jgi:hypothetical protein
MATFSDDSDYIFERFETLLKLVSNSNSWHAEYKHWSNDDDHWAKKWDKFHHFLWLLQCYEYFTQRGLDVSFPAPASVQARTSSLALPKVLTKGLQ